MFDHEDVSRLRDRPVDGFGLGHERSSTKSPSLNHSTRGSDCQRFAMRQSTSLNGQPEAPVEQDLVMSPQLILHTRSVRTHQAGRLGPCG